MGQGDSGKTFFLIPFWGREKVRTGECFHEPQAGIFPEPINKKGFGKFILSQQEGGRLRKRGLETYSRRRIHLNWS